MDLRTLRKTPPWEWPLDAGEIFQKILLDRRANESDRLIAAELAGDSVVIDDHLADALLEVVRNAGEPEQLRATAAASFGPALELSAVGFEDPDDVPISERMFRNIQDSLQKLYMDAGTPKEVRRRILEASVRSPETWHRDAIRHAYASGDTEWVLTSVLAMGWIRGFDAQILAALNNGGPYLQREAVRAAGNWALEAAWPQVFELIQNGDTPKDILLAAIEAAGSIRPHEAKAILRELADSADEDIADAADEALSVAGIPTDPDDEEEGG
jgi:hypothetical protein